MESLCGICGIVGTSDKQLIKRMCDVIEHRGPNDSGYFVDYKICLGNRRLSIIDLGGGHQPMHNEDESIWITFNGEIYNFYELRDDLERKGHKFYTNSDTEAIVHAYEEYGEDCPKDLRGMFGFAIWDKGAKKLFLARDRLGKKPLYYTVIDDKFIFGSEIKSILQYEGVKRKVNLRALHHFLTLQYVPGPDTMFEGIYKLPQGCSLVYQNGKIKISKYWNINMQMPENGNESYYSKKTLGLLKESVKIRLMSEVPLGVYLSGGIDSSSVVALMSTVSEEPIKTFTVGFGHHTDEFEYAKIVSEKFSTDHKELTVEPGAVNILPKIVWHFDEPVADPAALPTYLMSEATKKYVTVVLVGEGGDETFAGYPKYKIMLLLEKYHNLIPDLLKKKIVPKMFSYLSEKFPGYKKRKYLEFASEFFPILGDPSEAFLRLSALGFNENEKGELYSDEMKKMKFVENPMKPYFKDNNLFKQMLSFDMKVWLCDRLLMKVDKMTMSSSIEARVPLLDHKLVEFANTLPVNLRLNKYLFKKAMSDLLPKTILKRKKHGFSVPLGFWFEKDLKDITSEILLKLNKKEYFKYNYIQNILKKSQKFRHDHQLWNLLIFELWHKIFIDGDNIHKPQLSIDKLLG